MVALELAWNSLEARAVAAGDFDCMDSGEERDLEGDKGWHWE